MSDSMSLSCEQEPFVYDAYNDNFNYVSSNINMALVNLLTYPHSVENLEESIYHIKNEIKDLICNSTKSEKEFHNEQRNERNEK
jgi:hypothetical protein